jgi:hypothetical protein
MTPGNLAPWGWRIPFLISLLIAPVGVYVRRRLSASVPLHRPAQRGPEILRSHPVRPASDALPSCKQRLLLRSQPHVEMAVDDAVIYRLIDVDRSCTMAHANRPVRK